MLTIDTLLSPRCHAAGAGMPVPPLAAALPAASQRIGRMLQRLSEGLAPKRSLVHAGDTVYSAGTPFIHVYVVNSGTFKVVNASADGRCQVVDLQFRGDWLGFDGIADGRYASDAVATDTGEVWALRYDELLQACMDDAEMLLDLHRDMSRAITRGRGALLSRGTLRANARVADFLCDWAAALAGRGQRTDQIRLRMTRAEIGNYLGMTLESVSRALSYLVCIGVIRFTERGRRDIEIPDLQALGSCIHAAGRPDDPLPLA
jgi:CRP/FNR family transcriptional regulator, anaerobic regulatory protein